MWTLSCDFVHHFLLKHYLEMALIDASSLIDAHHNAGAILVSQWLQFTVAIGRYIISVFPAPPPYIIVQELCESRGGRPGLSVLTSLLDSVDVKNY